MDGEGEVNTVGTIDAVTTASSDLAATRAETTQPTGAAGTSPPPSAATQAGSVDSPSVLSDLSAFPTETVAFPDTLRTARAPVTSLDTSIFAQPETGRHVSAQIADIIRAGSDDALEVSLRPAELGRLTLGFSPDAGGLTVTLAAERPETLDLIRRNIGLLETDLRNLGYSHLNFSFGGGSSGGTRQGGGGSPDPRAGARADTVGSPGPLALPPQQTLGSGALDLRL
jgi:flagellar hook-length control protein FliK